MVALAALGPTILYIKRWAPSTLKKTYVLIKEGVYTRK